MGPRALPHVTRVTPDGRYTLRNNDFAEHRVDRPTERQLLTTLSELQQALEEAFRINLSKRPDLDEKLSSLIEVPANTRSI